MRKQIKQTSDQICIAWFKKNIFLNVFFFGGVNENCN